MFWAEPTSGGNGEKSQMGEWWEEVFTRTAALGGDCRWFWALIGVCACVCFGGLLFPTESFFFVLILIYLFYFQKLDSALVMFSSLSHSLHLSPLLSLSPQ